MQTIDCGGLMSNEKVVLRTDGGSRGNPGPAGIGFELRIGNDHFSAGAYIGECTNNVAEYQALIWGLNNALTQKIKHLHVQADSQLMVRQLLGEYQVKSADLKPLYENAKELLARFKRVDIEHISRELNKEADARANEAMDAQRSVGDYLVAYSDDEPQKSFDELLSESDTQTFPIDSKKDKIHHTLASAHHVAHTEAKVPLQTQDSGDTKAMAGTYSLTVKDHFDAAHNLYDYPGECRNLHGHTWDVEVTVVSSDLDGLGLVCDFKDLKAHLKEVLSTYDHTYINENAPFDTISPTAENLARIICERLSEILPQNVKVKEVAVWESPIARVGFSPS